MNTLLSRVNNATRGSFAAGTNKKVANNLFDEFSATDELKSKPSFLKNTRLIFTIGPGFGIAYSFLGGPNAPQHQVTINIPNANIVSPPPIGIAACINRLWFQTDFGNNRRELAFVMDYLRVALTYVVYFSAQIEDLNVDQTALFSGPTAAVNPNGGINFKDTVVYHNLVSNMLNDNPFDYLKNRNRGRHSILGTEVFMTGQYNAGNFTFNLNPANLAIVPLTAAQANPGVAGQYAYAALDVIVNQTMPYGLFITRKIIGPVDGFIFANPGPGAGYRVSKLRHVVHPSRQANFSLAPSGSGDLYAAPGTYFSGTGTIPPIYTSSRLYALNADRITDEEMDNNGIYFDTAANLFILNPPNLLSRISSVSDCDFRTKTMLMYIWSFRDNAGFINFINATNTPSARVSHPQRPVANPNTARQVETWVKYWGYLWRVHKKLINKISGRLNDDNLQFWMTP